MARSVGLFKSLGITLLVSGLAYGGGYVTAYLQGKEVESERDATVTSLESRLAEVKRSHVQENAELQQGLSRARNENEILEARRQLHEALEALDGRNFGVAEQKFHDAGSALGALECDAELTELASELKATRLPVSDDVSAQRQTTMDFARRFDARMGDMARWIDNCHR